MASECQPVQKIRDNSMDLLRVLSCLAVVLLHVNAQYFVARSANPSLTAVYGFESLINIITRFCVPAFIMISGAFVLSKQQNTNALQFYRKSLQKIFLPLVPAVIFFASYDKIAKSIGLRWIFSALVNGTYYNLWFMYMLFCLYALVPVLVRLKAVIPWRWWGRIGFSILAWAVVSQATSSYELSYDIGVAASYLGYFVTGSFLYENRHRIKLPAISASVAIIAVLVAVTFLVRYLGFDFYQFDQYRSFFSPSTVIISLLVFTIFCKTSVRLNLRGPSALTYYVYVFHTFVYSSLMQVLGNAEHELRTIGLVFVLTVAISFVVAKLYSMLWSYLFERVATSK